MVEKYAAESVHVTQYAGSALPMKVIRFVMHHALTACIIIFAYSASHSAEEMQSRSTSATCGEEKRA